MHPALPPSHNTSTITSPHPPPQAPQALLGALEHVVVLADSEAQVIAGQVGVGGSVELGGRDGGHAELHDQEPTELEIPRSVGHLRGEVVVRGQLDVRQIDEHKVAAFGFRVLVGLVKELERDVNGGIRFGFQKGERMSVLCKELR